MTLKTHVEQNNGLSDEELRRMYGHNYRVKDLVGKTQDPEVLKYYATHPFEPFRVMVAENMFTTSNILKLMVNDKSYTVASAVAKHKNLTVEIIEAISETGNILARETIARNPLTPEHVLYKLSEDNSTNSYKIKEALLTNPKLPEQLFMSLQGGDNIYRYANIEIMRNPALPTELIHQIWFSRKTSRNVLLDHPNLSPKLAWLALNSENASNISTILSMEEKNPKLFKEILLVGCKYWGLEEASENMPMEWLKSYLTAIGFKFEVPNK